MVLTWEVDGGVRNCSARSSKLSANKTAIQQHQCLEVTSVKKAVGAGSYHGALRGDDLGPELR